MKYFLMAVIFLISIISFFLFQRMSIYPFKCIAFSEYHLLRKGSGIIFNVSQDLRFYNEKIGFFNIRGVVEDDKGGRYIIDRKINLTRGKRIDNDTVEYNFGNIDKGEIDDTSEELYEILISEFTSSKESLQLDLINPGENVWVIGTSTSFVMTCYAY